MISEQSYKVMSDLTGVALDTSQQDVIYLPEEVSLPETFIRDLVDKVIIDLLEDVIVNRPGTSTKEIHKINVQVASQTPEVASLRDSETIQTPDVTSAAQSTDVNYLRDRSLDIEESCRLLSQQDCSSQFIYSTPTNPTQVKTLTPIYLK